MNSQKRAFTLVELLAVVAIVAMLAALLIPVLTHAGEEGRKARCLSNLKQLQLIGTMYSLDQDDRLVQVTSTPGAIVFYSQKGEVVILPQGAECPGWVSGLMDFSAKNQCNAATILLTDPRYSQFAAYNKNPDIFKCPSDRSSVDQNGTRIRRVRSYSLNVTLGATDLLPKVGASGASQKIPAMKRVSDIVSPPPARQFAFLDENSNSILGTDFWVDGLFGIDILNAIPASDHNGSGCLSFMDGHIEAHRWQDPRTRMPLTPKWIMNDLIFWGTLTRSSDAVWLHSRTAIPAASW